MKASLANPKVVSKLCDAIASGEGIAKICKRKDMPSKAAVYLRMASDPEFSTRIARAREAQQDAEVDAMIEMADRATERNWQVVRLRIWARQWRAAKLAPKKYGERMELAGKVEFNQIASALDAARKRVREMRERERGDHSSSESTP